jgi:YVTN family beta-propeller protein
VVNRDNNSVSVFDVANDKNQKVQEIPVGVEPRSIAITPNNEKVYETNTVSGTVWVIDAETYAVLKGIQVGTEPMGCALTPDGKKLYVANFGSDTVSVINTATDKVTATISLPATKKKPCAIAVSTANEVYVTSFLAHLPDDERTVDEKRGTRRRQGRSRHCDLFDHG